MTYRRGPKKQYAQVRARQQPLIGPKFKVIKSDSAPKLKEHRPDTCPSCFSTMELGDPVVSSPQFNVRGLPPEYAKVLRRKTPPAPGEVQLYVCRRCQNYPDALDAGHVFLVFKDGQRFRLSRFSRWHPSY